MNLYREESSTPKLNAQRNLCGRTHYVDDDTLRFHKSRILSTHITDSGLLFAITESVGLDMNNTRRGIRYVIFDVLGNVLARPNLEESFRTSKQADKAMWDALNALYAKEVTLTAIGAAKSQYAAELDGLADKVAKL
jgi:hypothetical protein